MFTDGEGHEILILCKAKGKEFERRREKEEWPSEPGESIAGNNYLEVYSRHSKRVQKSPTFKLANTRFQWWFVPV
jgi:hypothetical protein